MSHINYLSAKRKSVRKFVPGKIEPEQLQDILESALRAPTSKNKRGTYFVVVEDEETLSKLSKCRPMGSGFVKHAAVAIVVCVDAKKASRPYTDAAIAATYMQLAVTDNELGSCWCQVNEAEHAEEIVKRLLGLPEKDYVLCIIGIGNPLDQDLEPRNREPEWERVHIFTPEKRVEE